MAKPDRDKRVVWETRTYRMSVILLFDVTHTIMKGNSVAILYYKSKNY